jgi:hypothetical protein
MDLNQKRLFVPKKLRSKSAMTDEANALVVQTMDLPTNEVDVSVEKRNSAK